MASGGARTRRLFVLSSHFGVNTNSKSDSLIPMVTRHQGNSILQLNPLVAAPSSAFSSSSSSSKGPAASPLPSGSKLDLILQQRSTYRYFLTIPTRWMDNDQYGHVNNVVYYSYFDTVVNKFLMDHCGLDPSSARTREGEQKTESQQVIGLVAETRCKFYSSLSFPQNIEAGLAVQKLGSSSVIYSIGIFGESQPSSPSTTTISVPSTAAAVGYFVHVFVDPKTRKPTPIPNLMRDHLSWLLLDASLTSSGSEHPSSTITTATSQH